MAVIEYFFDTYALIALVEGSPSYARYTESRILTSPFNLVELYFIALKDFGEQKAKELYQKFAECLVEINQDVVFDAMKFRLANNKRSLSYADCIGYTYAKKHKLRFLTGDKQFENMENVEFAKGQ